MYNNIQHIKLSAARSNFRPGSRGYLKEGRHKNKLIDSILFAGKFAGEMTNFSDAHSFFPVPSPTPAQIEAGFRFGSVGTHSSRTLMLSELRSVLDHTAGGSDRAAYKNSVVEENCLGKPTASTRRLSFQRLSELYSLDPQVTLFRLLRRLWAMDTGSCLLYTSRCV